jgi:hypothetical protein
MWTTEATYGDGAFVRRHRANASPTQTRGSSEDEPAGCDPIGEVVALRRTDPDLVPDEAHEAIRKLIRSGDAAVVKSELVKPTHLARKAVVYILQSTPHQVVSNQESLRLPYAPRQRARELGWHEADIVGEFGALLTHINLKIVHKRPACWVIESVTGWLRMALRWLG